MIIASLLQSNFCSDQQKVWDYVLFTYNTFSFTVSLSSFCISVLFHDPKWTSLCPTRSKRVKALDVPQRWQGMFVFETHMLCVSATGFKLKCYCGVVTDVTNIVSLWLCLEGCRFMLVKFRFQGVRKNKHLSHTLCNKGNMLGQTSIV